MKKFLYYITTIALLVFINYNLINNQNLFAKGKINISTNGSALFDRINNEINILERVTIKNDEFKYQSNTLKIQYYNTDNLSSNLKQQNSSNFKHIEGNGNIIINVHDSILKGENYLYNVDKKVMVLRSNNNKRTTYEDKDLLISVNNRFEFQEESNLIVLRGDPIITFKNNTSTDKNTLAKAKLIYAKMNDDRKEIKFIQAFDNIEILTNDGAKIKANYGYYLPETGIMTLEDNVKMIRDGSVIEACKIIFDTVTGISEIIPCDDNVSGTFINK